jgi:hypothetical protein
MTAFGNRIKMVTGPNRRADDLARDADALVEIGDMMRPR